ncbi:MAG: hypothetical protein WKF71_19800 [Pyrinomonadaceae bacterium]
MSEKTTNLSEFINESFGANASYVEGLLSRFQNDPNLVDESWRTYFSELLNGGTSAATKQNSAENAAAVQAPENKIANRQIAVVDEAQSSTPEKNL